MGDGDDAAVAALRRGDATLGGAAFAALVRAGCGSIVANKAELNTINVFPVADGDTGTNMAMAAKGIAKRLAKIKVAGLGAAAAEVAEACVLSAQGNSGTILGFFFGALARHMAGVEAATPRELARILGKVGADMPDAVAAVVEGTLPTVARDSMADLDASGGFGPLLDAWAAAAAAATARTPEDLVVDGKHVLKGKNVVDSGAKGFSYFVAGVAARFSGEAVSNALNGGGDATLRLDATLGDGAAHDGTESVADGRYCTEKCGNQNVQDTFNMVHFERIWRERSSRPRDLEPR